MHRISFCPSPEGPFVVLHAELHELADAEALRRAREQVGTLTAGLPVVARARHAGGVVLRGEEPLHDYARSRWVDFTPVVTLNVVATAEAA